MNEDALKKAVAMAKKTHYLLVATSSHDGLPHVAAAGDLSLVPGERCVTVSAWFCPGTIANLAQNPRISLAIWDKADDTGYQLLGRSIQIEDMSVLDGGITEVEMKHPIPQVEKRIVVQVENVLEFKHAPHTDVTV